MENLFGVGSGVKFNPSDAVAVSYLFNKQVGQPLMHDEWVIKEVDLYGDQEPWELLGVDEKAGFFYTKLKKKSPNAKRYCRTVGKSGGTWSGVDKGKRICDSRGGRCRFIGLKKSFVYENKNNNSRLGCRWLMKEYSVDGDLLKLLNCTQRKRERSATVRDNNDVVVLCQIKKKVIKDNNRNSTSTTVGNNMEFLTAPPLSVFTCAAATAHNQNCYQTSASTVGNNMEFLTAPPVLSITYAPADADNQCYQTSASGSNTTLQVPVVQHYQEQEKVVMEEEEEEEVQSINDMFTLDELMM